jgi:hypothetical protein
MANTFTVLFRGAATTDSRTLYTVPAGTTTLVTSIVVTNAGGVDATYTIWLGGVLLANDVSVPANDSVIAEVKQVMTSDTAIDALASSTAVKWHISGLEIT